MKHSFEEPSMEIIRFAVEDTITVSGRDAEHVRVLRIRPEETVTICDQQGTDYRCRLTGSAGGTMTFKELVETAGLKVPYAEGVIGEIGAAISKWIEENPL